MFRTLLKTVIHSDVILRAHTPYTTFKMKQIIFFKRFCECLMNQIITEVVLLFISCLDSFVFVTKNMLLKLKQKGWLKLETSLVINYHFG